MATQSDLYSAARAEGLTPARAKVAAAVGMGESGGNLTAHNTNAATGDNSYGAWQINMLGDMGPERRALFGISSNDELYDLRKNAHAMRILSANGADFTPWSAYKNGAYKAYMENPVTDQSDDPNWLDKLGHALASPVTAPIDAAQSLGSVVQTVNKAARWISDSHNWVRVAYVVGGGALVIVGVSSMLASTSAGRALSNVVPAGRVMNVARKVAS